MKRPRYQQKQIFFFYNASAAIHALFSLALLHFVGARGKNINRNFYLRCRPHLESAFLNVRDFDVHSAVT